MSSPVHLSEDEVSTMASLVKLKLEPNTSNHESVKTPLALSGFNDLDNERRVHILGIIDKFRELGVNEDLSLPQVNRKTGPFPTSALG